MATGSEQIYSGSVNGKRTFATIRKNLLRTLASGQKTINQLANETKINWKTVENHLIYLRGRGLAREVFSSEYVRIFELTDSGKDAVMRMFPSKKIFEHRLIVDKRGILRL